MPNMFGGDSSHPAYDTRWKASADEDCVGTVRYFIGKFRGEWRIQADDVSGRTWFVDEPPTEKLRKRLEEKRTVSH